MAKKVMGQDGKMYKVKKPFYQRVWFWVVIVLIIAGFTQLGGEDKDDAATDTPASSEVGSVKVKDTGDKVEELVQEETPVESSVEVKPEVEADPSVSREFKNALGSANNYLDFSSFSKQGLYDQLLYEDYPEDAAQYAVDNVVTDWNENALESAINYLDFSSFSDQGLYDQLIYEGYTAEQAQYAIDNLPE